MVSPAEAQQIEYWPIDKLVLYGRNPRKNDGAVDRMCSSIREFGFSREGADAEYDGHYSRQVFDCLSLLAPPLRLAQMAYLTARNGLRTNTAASLAQLTGGEFFHYTKANDLRQGLIALSHDALQYYVLSFRPTSPTAGPHALHLEIKNHPQLTLKSRTEYWIDDDNGR